MKNMTERHERAQSCELKRWEKSNKKFDRIEALGEIEFLGVDEPQSVRGKVLDIGRGCGNFISLFSSASERMVVDPLYDKLGLKLKGIKGISCGGEELPLSSDSFDFVIVRNVVVHARVPEKIIKESLRVLRPTGKIYFMVNIFLSFLKPVFPFFNKLDTPHPFHFTAYDIRKLLTENDANIIRERIVPSFGFEWRFKRILGRVIKKEYQAILQRRLSPGSSL